MGTKAGVLWSDGQCLASGVQCPVSSVGCLVVRFSGLPVVQLSGLSGVPCPVSSARESCYSDAMNQRIAPMACCGRDDSTMRICDSCSTRVGRCWVLESKWSRVSPSLIGFEFVCALHSLQARVFHVGNVWMQENRCHNMCLSCP